MRFGHFGFFTTETLRGMPTDLRPEMLVGERVGVVQMPNDEKAGSFQQKTPL